MLDANRNEVWKRTYPGRPPRDAKGGLHVLYGLSPPVQGQYVRFVPQTPLSTSDGSFSISELQVIAPYEGVTINIMQNPAGVSVLEGRLASLGPVAAEVVGAPQDRLTYQWQRNGEDIPGATGATYTTPNVQTMADNNTEYSVKCAVSGQSVVSSKAKLTVTKGKYSVTLLMMFGRFCST